MGFVARSRYFVVSALPGPPQPGPDNGSEWLPGSFFRDSFGFFLGSPQPGPENGSEWVPGSFFRDSFRLFLGSPQPGSENGSEWVLGSFFRDSFGLDAQKWPYGSRFGAPELAFAVFFYMFAWRRSARNCNLTVNLRVSRRQELQKYDKIRMSGKLGSRKYAKICVSGRLGEQEYDRNAPLLCFYMFLSYV